MSKRKAEVIEISSSDAESSESDNFEPEAPPVKYKESSKKADARGRGRPPLSSEEKARRESIKATKPVRGRGRPKKTDVQGRPPLSSESDNFEPEAPPVKYKESSKKADARGRGRPPLSSEEKARRESIKATKPVRGRGRPKNTDVRGRPLSSESDSSEPESDSSEPESDSSEPDASPKKYKESSKKADARGRGRPPLSSEEKAKRESIKATKPVRGRGRPKKIDARGRGRPPLSSEEKAKRESIKATQPVRGRGRPKK